MTATLLLASLQLTGPVDPGTAPKLAIGQALTATVERSGIATNAGDRYTWSTPSAGAPFMNYTASATAAAYTPFTAPANTVSIMHCYFAKPGAPNVVCTFHSGALNVDIPLTRNLSVLGPQRTQQAESCGNMQLLRAQTGGSPPVTTVSVWVAGGSPPDWFQLWGGTYLGDTWGIYQVDKLKDPAILTSTGTFGYVQLRIRTSTLNSNPPEIVSGLDTGGFPSGGSWWNANDMDKGIFYDAPGRQYVADIVTFTFAGDYKLYLLYKPMDDVAGTSVYVPMFLLNWSAKGECASSNGVDWTQKDDGSGIASPAVDYTYDKFLEW